MRWTSANSSRARSRRAASTVGRRLDALEERNGVRSVEFLGDPRRELHHQVVQPTNHAGAMVADVDIALGQQPQHLAMISGHDLAQLGCSQRLASF